MAERNGANGGEIEYRPVGEAEWDDMVALFEGKGGPQNCWCLLWREPGKVRAAMDRGDRRAAMERRVRDGTPVGLLAYADGKPAGWCSVAPRETLAGLGGDVIDGKATWAIVCFFVRREHRRVGLSEGLLEAAMEVAKRGGAEVIEGYPVDPDSPSYRFMGQRSTFERAGFVETGMVGSRRHAMRFEVNA